MRAIAKLRKKAPVNSATAAEWRKKRIEERVEKQMKAMAKSSPPQPSAKANGITGKKDKKQEEAFAAEPSAVTSALSSG